MLSIPEAVQQATEKDGFLHFGLSNGVLNLSKTARFIKPLIEVRTKKSVSVAAITMALSRLKTLKKRTNVQLKQVKLDSINITKNLAEITFERTSHNIAALEKVEKEVRSKNGYIVITFGTTELTIIVEENFLPSIKKIMPASPKVILPGLVAVGAQFNENYIAHVGMVYALIQQLTFQNINVVEFSSTYTELVFYLNKKDMKLAFDTLYEQFM
ncbi:MAG: hypothetical protein V4449_00580 [Patescibacteria group bacterium]